MKEVDFECLANPETSNIFLQCKQDNFWFARTDIASFIAQPLLQYGDFDSEWCEYSNRVNIFLHEQQEYVFNSLGLALSSPIRFATSFCIFCLSGFDIFSRCAAFLSSVQESAIFSLTKSDRGTPENKLLIFSKCSAECFLPAQPLKPETEPPSNPVSGLKLRKSSETTMSIISDIFNAVSYNVCISVNRQYQRVTTLSLPWRLI